MTYMYLVVFISNKVHLEQYSNSGHLLCGTTLSMSRHIPTLHYLRSADTCLTRMRTVIYWLSGPAITDSANKCHVYDDGFNQKSLARNPTCARYFAQMSVLSSGDQRAIFTLLKVMNHVIVASWLRSFYDITS